MYIYRILSKQMNHFSFSHELCETSMFCTVVRRVVFWKLKKANVERIGLERYALHQQTQEM